MLFLLHFLGHRLDVYVYQKTLVLFMIEKNLYFLSIEDYKMRTGIKSIHPAFKLMN